MKFCNLFRHRRDGIIPGNRREFSFSASTSSLHRALQTVWIVERLHGSLSASAEPPSAYWVQRIAFDLLHACDSLAKLLAVALNRTLTLHHPHDGATTRDAFAADGSMPLFLSRDDVAIWDKQWDQCVGFSSAPTGRYTRRDSRYNFEKIAAVHIDQTPPLRCGTRQSLTGLNSGTPRNPPKHASADGR
jgi:hypothetical protein